MFLGSHCDHARERTRKWKEEFDPTTAVWESQWPVVRCGWLLATEPGPGVDQPEGHGGRVQNHLSPGALLVLLLQQLQTAVQLHNLKEPFTRSGIVNLHSQKSHFWSLPPNKYILSHKTYSTPKMKITQHLTFVPSYTRYKITNSL